jgi:hypothetical protein
MTTTTDKLAALDAKATPGHLFSQTPDYDEGGVAIIATDHPPDNTPTNGMVFWATMSPVERDEEDGVQAIANAAFLCALVNAYRANALVPRAEMEEAVGKIRKAVKFLEGGNPLSSCGGFRNCDLRDDLTAFLARQEAERG